MNIVNSTYMTALAVVLTLTTISSAHSTSSKEAVALWAAKVSLVQAVDMLEKDGKNKTVGAEFDIEQNIAIWEVKKC